MSLENTFAIDIIPNNDDERLKRLYSFDLLDSPPEKSFDDIAELAANVFGMPIALISLVDRDRVYFKANKGMEETKETSRGVSLCALGILTDRPLVIQDPLKDPCLIANPMVHGHFGLRFYAAAPLITDDGYNIGTICVLDKQTREFTASDTKNLQRFASVVMNEIKLRADASSRLEASATSLWQSQKYLGRLSQKLNNATDANRQIQFLSTHKFQEPLRKIMLYSNEALNKNKLEENLGKVIESAKYLRELFDDINSFSALEESDMNFGPVDLNFIIGQLVPPFKSEFNEIELIITHNQLAVIRGIASQILLLFSELLRNAINASKTGKKVKIEIFSSSVDSVDKEKFQAHLAEHNYCKIDFIDHGSGIEKSNFKSVFDLFNKFSNFSSKTSRGNGLAYCRKIVENHEGVLWVNDSSHSGTTFSMLLPSAVQ